jgi:hypothetical protein
MGPFRVYGALRVYGGLHDLNSKNDKVKFKCFLRVIRNHTLKACKEVEVFYVGTRQM